MEFIDVHKIDFFGSKLVLRAFWDPLGLLLDALGGLLGALLGLQIDPEGLTRSDVFGLGALFGLFFSLRAAEDGLKSILELSGGLFGSILSSEDDPPTLENLGFTKGIQ